MPPDTLHIATPPAHPFFRGRLQPVDTEQPPWIAPEGLWLKAGRYHQVAKAFYCVFLRVFGMNGFSSPQLELPVTETDPLRLHAEQMHFYSL
jgi:hypothetical protein